MDRWGRELIGRAVESLARYRNIWLMFVIVIPALAYPISRRLKFDQNVQSMFSEDDPRLLDFLYSKQRFGGDEFAIVAWEEKNLFADDGELTDEAAQRISAFAQQLSEIPGVQPESTQQLPQALRFRFRRERVRELIENVLVGEDGETTAVVLRLKPEEQTEAPRGDTIAAIRSAAREHDPPAAVVGEPVQVHDMFRIVQEDGALLFVVSLIILSIVLFVMFRSVRWVLLPIIAVVSTIACTEALLVVSQIRLSMVSSMLNSMVTIIVIATSTHVTVHYRELRGSLAPEEAMKQTLRDLAAPVFWTCATTAVGFLALLSSQITPVSSFGLMMGLAAMVAFGIFSLLLPGGVLLGWRRSRPHRAPAEEMLSRGLLRISEAIKKRPRLLWLVGLGLMLIAVPGLFRLRIETDFSRNFRESSEIVQSLQFVESRLGGAGIWEVNFPAPGLEDLDEAFLDRVRAFTAELREVKDSRGEPALKVASLTDGLDLLPYINVGVGRFRLDLTKLETRLDYLDKLQNEFVESLYNPEQQRLRIVLRSREQQRSEDKLEIIRRVQEMSKRAFGSGAKDDHKPPSATGMFVLLTFIIQSLLSDQLISFSLAAVGISLMMAFAFRSVTIGLLSLFPNVFPIVLVIGTMGWLGTPVNIGTAMIASVSMGLTVDSTIHYISAFRRAIETQSVDDAIRSTHQSVGRALVFAHVALIAGFLVLTLSDFIPLVYFGALLSLSMIGGLIGDLVMLPILLRWLYAPRVSDPGAGNDRDTSAVGD